MAHGIYHRVWMLGAWTAAALALTAAAPVGVDARLLSRLRQIEGAFRSGDASALRSSCSSGGKVRVDLKAPVEAQGSYGPGQLQVIFSDIFDASHTSRLEINADDVRVSAGTAFARGRWTRRPKDAGPEAQGTLTFTLREEAGDWRVLEIRSSR